MATETPTLPDLITCDATLYVDADGTWTICDDRDDHVERIDLANLAGPYRIIPLKITARPPADEPPVAVAVPDYAGTLEPASAEVG